MYIVVSPFTVQRWSTERVWYTTEYHVANMHCSTIGNLLQHGEFDGVIVFHVNEASYQDGPFGDEGSDDHSDAQ